MVSPVMPKRPAWQLIDRNLTRDETTELEGVRDEHASAILQLRGTLAVLACPDVALLAAFVREVRRLLLGNLQWLEIVGELIS